MAVAGCVAMAKRTISFVAAISKCNRVDTFFFKRATSAS